MGDRLIGYTFTADGIHRPSFEQLDGRQYIQDDEGEPEFGVWRIPQDEADLPIIVT